MKTAYAGAGLALMAGLLMGAAMKPDLAGDDRPAGPQIFAGWSGTRATGPFDDDGAAFASYAGQIPDYVMGTDWKRLTSAPAVASAAAGARDADADAEPVADTSYYRSPLADEPPAPPLNARDLTAAVYGAATSPRFSSYPSLDGGAAYGEASRAENTPLVQDADIEREAPPEATGDTRVER